MTFIPRSLKLPFTGEEIGNLLMMPSETESMSSKVSFSSVVPRGKPTMRNSSCQWSGERTSPRTYLSTGTIACRWGGGVGGGGGGGGGGEINQKGRERRKYQGKEEGREGGR